MGSEAVRSGRLTAYALRTRYVAIHPDVYLPRGAQLTPLVRAQASWLWTGRRGSLQATRHRRSMALGGSMQRAMPR